MSVRMRHTRGHTNNRRSHHALEAVRPIPGEKEGTYRLPHRIDEATGLYRGRQIASAPKAKRTERQKHDHPRGTHHERVPRNKRNAQKPAEPTEAPAVLNKERGAGARFRFARGSKKEPSN